MASKRRRTRTDGAGRAKLASDAARAVMALRYDLEVDADRPVDGATPSWALRSSSLKALALAGQRRLHRQRRCAFSMHAMHILCGMPLRGWTLTEINHHNELVLVRRILANLQITAACRSAEAWSAAMAGSLQTRYPKATVPAPSLRCLLKCFARPPFRAFPREEASLFAIRGAHAR